MNYQPTSGTRQQKSSTTGSDIFSVLSSSKPSSRSLTPSNASRPSTQTGQTSTSSNVDAFSSLLGTSFSNAGNSEKLSLAERRAAALKENEAKASIERTQKEKESAAWSGLDMLGQQSSNLTATSSARQTPSLPQDDWLSDSMQPPKATTQSHTPIQAHSEEDDWGLADFGKPSGSAISSQAKAKSHNLDPLLDGFDDSSHNRDELSLLGQRQFVSNSYENNDAEDDILGMLGKPVESLPKREPPTQAKSQVPLRNGRSSPPPHVIGQIVEMGFSPDQARLALTATDTGLDVQQALEMLLSNGAGAEESALVSGEPHTSDFEFRDRDEDDYERPPPARSRRAAQEHASPSSAALASRRAGQTPPASTNDMQDKADKLLAQASEIGLSMFNRANALLKDGRERMQKAYEERAAKPKPTDGRPRWMVDAQSAVNENDGAGHSSSSFRDHDEPEHTDNVPQRRREDKRPEALQVRPAPKPAAVPKPVNLFDEEPAIYVSPARRRAAASRSGSQGVSPAPTPPMPQQRQATPILRTRQTASAGMSEINAYNTYKTKGTEMFKLGQYAEAEKAYSAALSTLPANHLLIIPLLNNRALSRTKTGEYNGAIEDCTNVLSIIGADYNPSLEAKVMKEEEGASVDLADALIKAYRRRAEAYEGREKWDLAQKDWEAIISCSWSIKMRNDAQSGAARCRKAVAAERNPPIQAKPKRPPRPAVIIIANSEAVNKVREANRTQEEEEQTKATLKDSVDSKLLAWRAGKETNIRALVASLENVLWPELEWQKVGLHELVSPGQVKIRYMKAIAKLHPDKLNSGNTTVEQRMIANGVFSALNDAWLAFKQ